MIFGRKETKAETIRKEFEAAYAKFITDIAECKEILLEEVGNLIPAILRTHTMNIVQAVAVIRNTRGNSVATQAAIAGTPVRYNPTEKMETRTVADHFGVAKISFPAK